MEVQELGQGQPQERALAKVLQPAQVQVPALEVQIRFLRPSSAGCNPPCG